MPFSPLDSQPHEYLSGILVPSLSSLLWNVLDGQYMRAELSQKFLKSIVGDTNGPKDFSWVGNTLLSQLFKLEDALGAKLVEGQGWISEQAEKIETLSGQGTQHPHVCADFSS